MYVLLAIPLLYLRIRRFIQSRRERREYLTESESFPNA
jgi:hypothetical protein